MNYQIFIKDYQIILKVRNANIKDLLKVQDVFYRHSEYLTEYQQLFEDENFRTNNHIFESDVDSFSMNLGWIWEENDKHILKIISKYFEEKLAQVELNTYL